MAWDYSGFTRIGAGIGGAAADKRKAEEEERRRKAQSQAFVRTSGLSQTDPAIATEIESGNLGIDEGMTALRTKQAQEKIRKEAEEAANAFQATVKADEAQIGARDREEANLVASGAMRTVPPGQQRGVAANIADETEPSQQFSMRQGLQKRTEDVAANAQKQIQQDAQEAAKTFYAQKELSGTATPEDKAQAFGKGIVTASQIGIGKKPAGATFPTPTQQAARTKDIAYKQIEVDSHKRLPEFQQQYLESVPVEMRVGVQGGQIASEAEKLRKRYVDEQQLKWLQENPLQSQDEVDAVYESLQDELQMLMEELNDLKR